MHVTETAASDLSAVSTLAEDVEAAQDDGTVTDTLNDALAVAAWTGAEARTIARKTSVTMPGADFIRMFEGFNDISLELSNTVAHRHPSTTTGTSHNEHEIPRMDGKKEEMTLHPRKSRIKHEQVR